MREGFDQDDIYIMVEDQFQSVAQSFTQHLHKAEYRRLVEEAKKQKASTIRDISRPTDAFTAMSTETLKIKEARELSAKQKAGLKAMKAAAGRPSLRGADDDSDLEKDKADDPWVGTTLHGLMTSPKKSQEALVGLHGVKSATRAAAGFAKSDIRAPVERKGLMDLDLSKEPESNNAREKPIEVDEDETTSGDEDDLDALPTRLSRPTKNEAQVSVNQKITPLQSKFSDPDFFKKYATSKTEKQKDSALPRGRSAVTIERSERSSKPIVKTSKKFIWLDDFDDIPGEPQATLPMSKESKVKHKPNAKASRLVKSEKDTQVTVVPTFLV
jgi:hypothetical protein